MRLNSIFGKISGNKFFSFWQFVILLIFIGFIQNCRPAAAEKIKQRQNSFKFMENISYKTGYDLSEYEKERCKLDLYLPQGKKDFPLMVWFHGGSLQRGDKNDSPTKALAERFAGQGVAVGVVNYRLSPKVKYPSYIDDAAAAVAWAMNHISEHGGNPGAVFIGGHSAGGYLSLMLALQPAYLAGYGIDHISIAGIISIGGQTFTHYAIREERGLPNPETTPLIDEGAPCFHARKSAPPILAVWSDGDSPDRKAENRYLEAILNKVGNNGIYTKEIENRNHWTLITKIPQKDDPLNKEILMFINKIGTAKNIKKNKS